MQLCYYVKVQHSSSSAVISKAHTPAAAPQQLRRCVVTFCFIACRPAYKFVPNPTHVLLVSFFSCADDLDTCTAVLSDDPCMHEVSFNVKSRMLCYLTDCTATAALSYSVLVSSVGSATVQMAMC
jgi:hypothetical protein